MTEQDDFHPSDRPPIGLIRMNRDGGLRAWAWRMFDAGRWGGFLEVSPGDTIAVVLWLGPWAARVGWDWEM